jgi:hypothetical protein
MFVWARIVRASWIFGSAAAADSQALTLDSEIEPSVAKGGEAAVGDVALCERTKPFSSSDSDGFAVPEA